MKAKDFDTDIDCPICTESDHDFDEYGGCPRCGGDGQINRFRDGETDRFRQQIQGEQRDTLVLDERVKVRSTGLTFMVDRQPVDPDVGGFNARYGDEIPSDDAMERDPIASFEQDMKDRLQNRLGENAENGSYILPEDPYNGAEYSGSDLPDQAKDVFFDQDDDHDPDIDQVIAWLRCRNDDCTANLFERLKDEQGL